MGLLSRIDNWMSSRQRSPDQPPIMVVQYGSTKSYTFRREALRGSWKLPNLSDQERFIAVLRCVEKFYLPMLSDEDFDNLRQLLVIMDDVILAGLKDPSNWVLPRGFSDHPFVRPRLDKNYPIELILDYMLDAARLYVWWYRDDEGVNELIPHLLELEESFGSLQTRLQDVSEQSQAQGREYVDSD